MGVRPRAVAPLHKALQVVVVCPAGHRDLAGARELANAITAEEVFHGVELGRGSRGFDGERVFAHVDHFGTKDVCDFDDLVATLGRGDICYAAGSIPRGVALPLFLRAKNGGHVKSRLIHLLRGERLVLDFEGDDYPIQADGEQIRAHKATVSVLPGALTVLKPRHDVTK